MALRDYPNRFLFASILSSLLVLGLCGTVAVFLAAEQSRTADILAENIGSRRAAANLEEVMAALALLHQRGVRNVAPLHERAEGHLADVRYYADKEKEREFVRRIAKSYRRYLSMWVKAKRRRGPQPELVRQLEDDCVPACQRLQDFNMSQIDESEREHLVSVQRMTWGLAAVGGLASVGGLVLGFGLARGLRRTIHQFLVQIQGAADLLGPEPATVAWQRDGQPLREGADELLHRVEQAIVRLQHREREVRRAERLATLGQLAAGVAHEIRNPLTSVLLLLQTARKDPTAGGLTEEDIDLIEQELLRIERSLQVFLDFARPPKLAWSACDLGNVVQDALALARGRIEQQKVSVDLDVPQGGFALDADREQLKQVVLNVILNALDAMPHGGRLGLQIADCRDQSAIELTVTDTGAGIPPQIIARLFEPFATGKETGLGLGLVISKRIVEEHGGTIHGANRPEGGASFVVRLPKHQSEIRNGKRESNADLTLDR